MEMDDLGQQFTCSVLLDVVSLASTSTVHKEKLHVCELIME